jgi:hypothetical protein
MTIIQPQRQGETFDPGWNKIWPSMNLQAAVAAVGGEEAGQDCRDDAPLSKYCI